VKIEGGKTMANNNSSSSSNSIGFTGLLAILFIGLKLTGFIAWSWLWVISPIWIVIIFYLLFTFFFELIVYSANKKF